MTSTHNHWQVYDTSEPLLQWQLAVPAGPSAAAELVAEVRAALLPLVTVVGADLPGIDDALGRPGLFSSTITARDDRGALVDVDSATAAGDAGQLLRRLEGPALDAGYARRFAAVGHPFVAVWTTTATTTARFAVTVAFFATVWFDATDAALFERNQARLLAARSALTTLARRRGGLLQAPTTLTARG